MCVLVWRTIWWRQSSSLSRRYHSSYCKNVENYLQNQSWVEKEEMRKGRWVTGRSRKKSGVKNNLVTLFWKLTDCRINYWLWIYCERETLLLHVVMFSMWLQFPQSFFGAVVPHDNLSIIASCTHYKWDITKSKKLIRNFFLIELCICSSQSCTSFHIYSVPLCREKTHFQMKYKQSTQTLFVNKHAFTFFVLLNHAS